MLSHSSQPVLSLRMPRSPLPSVVHNNPRPSVHTPPGAPWASIELLGIALSMDMIHPFDAALLTLVASFRYDRVSTHWSLSLERTCYASPYYFWTRQDVVGAIGLLASPFPALARDS